MIFITNLSWLNVFCNFHTMRSLRAIYCTKQNAELTDVIFTHRGDTVLLLGLNKDSTQEHISHSKVPKFLMIYIVLPIISQISFVPSPAGVTLASSLRRRPNCFNLLHQMEIMMRSGYSGESAINNLEVPN